VAKESLEEDEILLASRFTNHQGPKYGKLFDNVLYYHFFYERQKFPRKSNIAIVKATAGMVAQRFKYCKLDTSANIDDLTSINDSWVCKFLTRHRNNDEAWYLLQEGNKQEYPENPTPIQMDVLYQTSENEVFYD
jgi:hypothetical protein